METVKASITWPGPDLDVLRLHVEPWLNWDAEPVDDFGEIAILWEIDDDEERTGRLAGVEVVGFLTFERWHDLPELPVLWELPGEEAAPLVDVLRRVQARLRRRVLTSTS